MGPITCRSRLLFSLALTGEYGPLPLSQCAWFYTSGNILATTCSTYSLPWSCLSVYFRLGSSLGKELRYISVYVLAYIPVRHDCVQLIIVYPGTRMCDMHLPWYAHACYK
jgi:hypothetical protein